MIPIKKHPGDSGVFLKLLPFFGQRWPIDGGASFGLVFPGDFQKGGSNWKYARKNGRESAFRAGFLIFFQKRRCIEKNIGKRRCFSVMGGFFPGDFQKRGLIWKYARKNGRRSAFRAVFPEDFQKWGSIWKNIGKHEKGGRRARRS